MAAVLPFYAPVDQRQTWCDAGIEHFDEPSRSHGCERTSPARPARGFADHFVRPGLPPFLLVHGTGDPSVPYDQSTRMQSKLRDAGVDVELISIDGGSHGMARWETLDPGYKERVVAWLAQRLGITTRSP